MNGIEKEYKEKTEIKVYNSLKEYEITTACGENGKKS